MKCCICNKKQQIGHGGLFQIPENRRNKWSEIFCLKFSPCAKICMDHFSPSSVVKLGGKFRLLPNAEPIPAAMHLNTDEQYDMEHPTRICNENFIIERSTQVPMSCNLKTNKKTVSLDETLIAENEMEINMPNSSPVAMFPKTAEEYVVENPNKNCLEMSKVSITNSRSTKVQTYGDPAIDLNNEDYLIDNYFIQSDASQAKKFRNLSCTLGCPYPKRLYAFPSHQNDEKRRQLWLDFFDMSEPNTECVFACERHFSRLQTTETGIRLDAIPDVPTVAIPNGSLNIVCDSPADVLKENLVNINNNVSQEKSLIQMSIAKIESRTISTQTNTRLCGTIQVSEFADDYRLNCFYCYETFLLENWKKFMTHINKKHSYCEEAFEIYKYVSDDHDYTPINAKLPTAVEVVPVKNTSQIETLVLDQKLMLPELMDPLETSYNISNKNKSLALPAITDVFNNSVKSKESVYVVDTTIDKENISCVSTKNVAAETITDIIPMSFKKEKKTKIDITVLKPSTHTVKNRAKNKEQVLSSEDLSLKNVKRKKTDKTDRCCRRSNKIETVDAIEIEDEFKSTELTFEYTPHDIIDFLLDNIKNYAVLWQFDESPFNEDYNEAIEVLCRIINEKWSLNIDTLKMRRSVNRIFRFYCSLYPCENLENINQFTCYYDKCALFLPASVHDIAYARCSHCYRCYKNDSELKAHLLEEQRYLQWPFKCVECKECFRDNDEYELHRRLPHYQEVFRCQLCKKRFTRRNKYNRHVFTHQIKQSEEPGKYECNVCGKVFKVSGELRNHKIYHGEKKHKCHLCPKKFFTNALLIKHIEAHNKEYRLMCEVCGKGFINHNNLREHMNKHTGAKVTCNICNLKLRKSSLSRHLRLVHVACEGTIETTYRARNHHYRSLLLCPNKRRFKKRGNYTNYNCKICNIHFDGYKYLLNHNKEYHSDAPKMSCKLCSSEFKHKVNLKRHYRVKHDFHVYQVYKLIEKNEDLDTVLSINKEELDKLCETLAYSTEPGPSSPKYLIDTTIVKSDASSDDLDIEEERLIDSDVIQDEIMSDADNINMSEHEIKIDDDHYMNDFFTNLLK